MGRLRKKRNWKGREQSDARPPPEESRARLWWWSSRYVHFYTQTRKNLQKVLELKEKKSQRADILTKTGRGAAA
ncbi:hypothetical protein SKAU_G00005860 [Synaphobranchus kaupii]|uniref:Uncharacterized protein n=1 Tax=Synaphobranchus kaupii TaxID=118154 RepID=A0A9Q1G9Y3_SYNKA|nr:hypothetical protein SKAU_G00005860 [Synaphobranchus kaupii]